MEAENNKKATPKTNTDLTSVARKGGDAEGPSLAQNTQGNETQKEKKEKEQEQMKKEQEREQQKKLEQEQIQQQEYGMGL